MTIIKHMFSTCEIVGTERVFKKYNNDHISFELYDNEINWYKRFQQSPSALLPIPKLIDYSKNTLVLEYAGNPISKNTKPANFKNQLRQIASFLTSHSCQHCDIMPGNLLVLNSKIYIIDFGWAVEMDQDPYRKWKNVDKSILNLIGDVYRGRNWPDDKYSLTKIYREFSGNPNKRLFFADKVIRHTNYRK